MSEAVVDDIVAVLPPLLQSLEALSFVARHLNPPDFDRVMQAIGSPEDALQAARAELTEWPENFADVRAALEAASDAALLMQPCQCSLVSAAVSAALGPSTAWRGRSTSAPRRR